MPTWLYWQSLEQMQRYGIKADEGANKILGACDFQATFRLNDNASAEWMSRRIGVVDRVVEKKSVSKDLDTWSSNRTDSVSYSTDLVKEPIIFPHELGCLKQNEFVCMYRGKAWKGDATPYFQLRPEYQDRYPAASELRGGSYQK
jgi:type IV secretory pathway TraG/TraD family ATPase VirD4